MIRIGVNALYLIPGGVGGTEIYLRNLLLALAEIDSINEYIIFTNRETGSGLVPQKPNFQYAPQSVRARFRPARILWEQLVLPFAAARRGVQVMFNPGFVAPWLAKCPNVTVFHDFQHKRHPQHFRWFDLPFWRMLLYWSARRSRKIIAVSVATAADFAHFYPALPATVTVVPHGVERKFFEIGGQRSKLEPMLLCVSTLHPHKNIDGLLQAFAIFHKSRSDFRLVVAGLRGFYATELDQLRASLGLQDCVTFTGWISQEALYDLFRRASAFIYPSRFEGFGMPIQEALAAGIPSACSNVEPMKSLVSTAALQFDPSDTAAICQAIERLTSDQPLRHELSVAGPQRAAQFSWQKSARATLEVLLSAA